MQRPTVDDLEAALGDVLAFMELHDLPCVGEVRGALAELSVGAAHGARRYLALNRALTDVYFSPVNGNASNERDGERLTDAFRELHGRAFSLADALLRTSR